MAEFREAPTLVVLETQLTSLKTDLQHSILCAENRDHVLEFPLSPGAQHRWDELGTESRPEVYFRGNRSLVGHYGLLTTVH
jgi:hypothetical protein